jgi:hypothetical protein
MVGDTPVGESCLSAVVGAVPRSALVSAAEAEHEAVPTGDFVLTLDYAFGDDGPCVRVSGHPDSVRDVLAALEPSLTDFGYSDAGDVELRPVGAGRVAAHVWHPREGAPLGDVVEEIVRAALACKRGFDVHLTRELRARAGREAA